MHARLNNTQSKLNFYITTCKPRLWIAFYRAISVTKPIDSDEKIKTTKTAS